MFILFLRICITSFTGFVIRLFVALPKEGVNDNAVAVHSNALILITKSCDNDVVIPQYQNMHDVIYGRPLSQCPLPDFLLVFGKDRFRFHSGPIKKNEF